ncbi:Spo0E family sporulation regulatory protein-aspartic acid phosphatase [Paenibacillaceae bacterium]|nr:Spo0E family sporulation regulatory protein-aspartic acid phosphatase [Paenibacillaceae bacterium]
MDKHKLLHQLQELQQKLREVAEARGSLTDPDVLAVSEEVDQLILIFQKIQKSENSLS